MSERYGKLFSLPENLYTEGSPVILAAGALLKDNQTGKVLAQLKFQSISPKKIKALTVCIQPLDTVGNPLGDTVAYQYLDLCADRDSEFGQKTPIALPDAATRSFQAFVTEVIFENNTTWTQEIHLWESLKRVQTLSVLQDSELEQQFRLDYGLDCANLLLEQKGLWYCVCGSINQQGEDKCHKCDRAYADLKAIDMDSLRARKAERLAKEKADAEAAQRKAQEQAKTFKKNAIRVGIVAACIAVVVIAVMLISDLVAYNSAVALMESGQYKEAIAAFEAMDGYRDSIDQISECGYRPAVALMEAGQYEEAIAAFEALNDYKDSAEKITACENAIAEKKYQNAVALLEAGQYEEAIAEFEMLGTYKDSSSKALQARKQNLIVEHEKAEAENAVAYIEAEKLLENGDIFHAAIAFYNISGYQDARTRSMELWDSIAERKTLCVGDTQTIGLTINGTVRATTYTLKYGYSGQCEVSGWKNIIAISTGKASVGVIGLGTHTVGLQNDGCVKAVGANLYGQCDVSGWRDIVAIDAGWIHTVGLKADGTVVATGNNEFGQCNVSGWTDIIAISAGSMHTVALKADGTVVAVGNNKYEQCNISDWTDIIAVSAGDTFTVGVKADGTVVAVGDNKYGQCNVSDWTNITSISTWRARTIGLRSDGTVVAAGETNMGASDVSNWKNVVEISTGNMLTIGLKADGTFVYSGLGISGSKDISDWTDIKAP